MLYGQVQDRAALCGLLDRILSLGLEVVEVQRLPTTPDELGANPSPAVTPVELHEPAAELQDRLGHRARRAEARPAAIVLLGLLGEAGTPVPGGSLPARGRPPQGRR